MKKQISSVAILTAIALLFLVACTHKPIPVKEEEAGLPPVTPSPVEQVTENELTEVLKDADVSKSRTRARKLLEIILGGVNR